MEPARPAPASLAGAERQLREAALRALRQPRGKVALVLHLSSLANPRPHHVRVARVLLQETAQRFGGQVFAMRNHDLVLLCTEPEAGQPAQAHAHTAGLLPDTMAQLFSADVPRSHALTSLWRLDRDRALLDGYLAGRAQAGAATDEANETGGQPVSLAALQEILAKAPLPGLMVQQTGLALSPDRSRTLSGRLSPAFQAVSIGLGGLNLDALLGHALADPTLERHLAGSTDTRLLALLLDDLGRQGRLLRPAAAQCIPVVVCLGLRAIVSPAFAALARAASSAGLVLWVAIRLLEAASDLALFEHARGLLRLTGCRLVVTGIDPQALGLVRPDSLGADLVVLAWGPALLRAVSAGPGAAFMARVPAGGVLLDAVDGEPALAWGQAHGVSLFSGPWLDQVQAATRMQRCHSASGCTLRLCLGRAASLGEHGRAGCANPALLSAGLGSGR